VERVDLAVALDAGLGFVEVGGDGGTATVLLRLAVKGCRRGCG
jgi:hypothetical protein